MINRKFGSNWTNNLDWLDFNVFKKFKMAENPSRRKWVWLICTEFCFLDFRLIYGRSRNDIYIYISQALSYCVVQCD